MEKSENTIDTMISAEELQELLQKKNFSRIRKIFSEIEDADIAELLEELEPTPMVNCFKLIDHEEKAEVFSHLSIGAQEVLAEKLPSIAVVVNEMEAVDRTMFLETLSPEVSSKLLQELDPEERQIAWQLLSYPEDSVGRMMSPSFVSIPEGLNVSEAIEWVRWNASRFEESALSTLFVVKKNGEYLGDTTLGALFVADDTAQKIEEIAGSAYVSLFIYDDEETAVDTFRKYDKNSIAVVDENNRLMGVVRAENVFDVAEEEATEDIQQFGGAQSLENSYFETSIFTLVKKRAGWLILLFIGGLFSGQTLKMFEPVIAMYTFLIVFLPQIVASGGNSGSQAASLVIRGLAIREMDVEDWKKIFGIELLSGLILGTILGVLGVLYAIFLGLEWKIAIVVFISLIWVCTFGAMMGGLLPLILKKVGLDPAVSSSPLIASLADIFGILIFFNLAIFVLNYF